MSVWPNRVLVISQQDGRSPRCRGGAAAVTGQGGGPVWNCSNMRWITKPTTYMAQVIILMILGKVSLGSLLHKSCGYAEAGVERWYRDLLGNFIYLCISGCRNGWHDTILAQTWRMYMFEVWMETWRLDQECCGSTLVTLCWKPDNWVLVVTS